MFQVATAGEAVGMRMRTVSADGYHRAALSNFTAKLTQRYNVRMHHPGPNLVPFPDHF